MYSIPYCEDKATVFNIFDQLSNLNEDKIQGIYIIFIIYNI